MLVIYDTFTGQTERFSSRLGIPKVSILDYEGGDEELFLVTRSYDFGNITPETKEFLDNYAHQVIGLAVGSNRNWGFDYGKSGDIIEKEYGIELVLKFEGSGLTYDVAYCKQWIQEHQSKSD